MPSTFLVDDSPIPPQLDRAGPPSQLFQPPTPSASSALYRSISLPSAHHHRKRARISPFHSECLDSPDEISAEVDYRPSRYKDHPRPCLPLDDPVQCNPDFELASRKRSRRDPPFSTVVAPSSPSEKTASQTAPVRWSRAVLDVVGKMWDFCWSGAFRGFHAGGGPGYTMAATEQNRFNTSRMTDSFIAASAASSEKAGPSERSYTGTPVPGEYPEERGEELHHWVLVTSRRDRDADADEASPCVRRRRTSVGTTASTATPRRTTSYTHVRSPNASTRRRVSTGKRTLMTSSPASHSLSKAHFASPAKPRESPVSVETQRYMAQRRRMEREEDASLRRLNRQLKDMIREGKEALGTRVEVDEDYDMED